MSEFNNGANEPFETIYYDFVIIEQNLTQHHFSPVEAYTFLTYGNSRLLSIVVLRNHETLISLGPEYGTRNYIDSMSGLSTQADARSVFQYINSIDISQHGNFQSVYENEYIEKKEAGEEAYNPFSQILTNLNWETASNNRKENIRSLLPKNFNKQFENKTRSFPHGKWQGATPTGRKRKTRSRKTRKIRR